MFGNSFRSKSLLLAGLALLATNPAGAQIVPGLTVTDLEPTVDDEGPFGPPIGFGTAVGISGTTAVVGIPEYFLPDPTESFALEIGRVGVYTQGSDGTWTRTASIVPTDRQANEGAFGQSVSLVNNILIVGSSYAVRIFVNENGTWTQTATLPQPSGTITFDGRYLVFVANAPTSPGGPGGNAPAFLLYLYTVAANGQPQLLGTLSPSNLTPGGLTLGNGILAVKGLDSNGNGLVDVYSVDSPTPTVPQVLSSGETTPDSSFGSSIAIWNQTILIGAPGGHVVPNDNTGGSFSGAAYVFAPGAHGWVQTQKIVPNSSAGFGTSVGLNQAGALISAPYSDDNFGTILGGTQIWVWQGNQLVFAQALSEGRSPTGTSMALSGNEAILGTEIDGGKYGFYEYADILNVTGSTSP